MDLEGTADDSKIVFDDDDDEKKSIQIFIVNEPKPITTLNVQLSSNIGDVKAKIDGIEGRDSVLIFNGTMLEDNQTLSFYDIEDQCILLLLTEKSHTPIEEVAFSEWADFIISHNFSVTAGKKPGEGELDLNDKDLMGRAALLQHAFSVIFGKVFVDVSEKQRLKKVISHVNKWTDRGKDAVLKNKNEMQRLITSEKKVNTTIVRMNCLWECSKLCIDDLKEIKDIEKETFPELPLENNLDSIVKGFNKVSEKLAKNVENTRATLNNQIENLKNLNVTISSELDACTQKLIVLDASENLTEKEKDVKKQQARFIHNYEIPKQYRDEIAGIVVDKCLLDTQYKRTYNESDGELWGIENNKHYYVPEPLDRGGKPYYLPKGWTRYGIKVNDFDKYVNWHVAYHGTKSDHILSILVNGLRTPGKDVKQRLGQYGADKPAIYVSPSIEYAASPFYSVPFKYGDKWAQMVFQCRTRPPPDKIQKDPTDHVIGNSKNLHNKISNDELEWLYYDQNNIQIYGIMIRESDEEPKHLYERDDLPIFP